MLNACIICHKKKIKCTLVRQQPCSNCSKAGFECIPYRRKRKRYTNSLSPRGSISTSRRDEPIAPTPPPQSNTPRFVDTQSQPEPDTIQTYRGRDRYLGRHVAFNEAMIPPANGASRLSDADLQMLTQQGAFTLPPKDVQDEFIATFMRFGHVWTPIVDGSWLSGESVSYLLLQAIFLAASRMATERSSTYGSSADFYRRAKLLFFFGNERDPLISIVSAILLHWYNPVGPETVSTDTSGFWLRTAEAIAFQIGLHKEPSLTDKQRGLRRRLWWTLVLRDCIISAGVGRPRTINLRDSDVLPPSLGDFAHPDINARIFLVYVPICQLLGDIVESCLRRDLQPSHQRIHENALYRWAKQDFPTIHPSTDSYSFETRQVLVAYFANLIILDRSPTPDTDTETYTSLSPRSLLAASFITGIFREFLEKDELCRLGPVFTFYALCAGLVLIPALRVQTLRGCVEEEILILKAALQVLSKQWGSAFGALRALQKLSGDVLGQAPSSEGIPGLNEEMVPFFEGFSLGLCRLWGVVHNEVENPTEPVGSILIGAEDDPAAIHAEDNSIDLSRGLDIPMGNWEGLGVDWSGSWLLDNMF